MSLQLNGFPNWHAAALMGRVSPVEVLQLWKESILAVGSQGLSQSNLTHNPHTGTEQRVAYAWVRSSLELSRKQACIGLLRGVLPGPARQFVQGSSATGEIKEGRSEWGGGQGILHLWLTSNRVLLYFTGFTEEKTIPQNNDYPRSTDYIWFFILCPELQVQSQLGNTNRTDFVLIISSITPI